MLSCWPRTGCGLHLGIAAHVTAAPLQACKRNLSSRLVTFGYMLATLGKVTLPTGRSTWEVFWSKSQHTGSTGPLWLRLAQQAVGQLYTSVKGSASVIYIVDINILCLLNLVLLLHWPSCGGQQSNSGSHPLIPLHFVCNDSRPREAHMRTVTQIHLYFFRFLQPCDELETDSPEPSGPPQQHTADWNNGDVINRSWKSNV